MTRLLALMLILAPGAALAHAGHGTGGFWTGALHPVGGADHVLAMVAVGILAAMGGRQAVWALPGAFVAAMLAGALAGAAGMPFPAVEPVILASVTVLGVMVALAARLPLGAGLAIVVLAGLAHGWAHGSEGPAGGLAPYAAGFVLATLGLHLGGIALARGLPPAILRTLGAATGLAGPALALAG